MKKYTRISGYKTKKTRFEKISKKPSEAIPDQSLSIRQLIDAQKRGLVPPIQHTGSYEMETFGEELNPLRKQNFDLSDIDTLKQRNQDLNTYVTKKQLEADKQAQIEKNEQLIKDYEAKKAEEEKRLEKVKEVNKNRIEDY